MELRGALNTALYTRLLQDVRVKMEAGTSRPCLSALLWEAGPSSGLSETEMAYFTAMPFAAGTSTVRDSLYVAPRTSLTRTLDIRLYGIVSQ